MCLTCSIPPHHNYMSLSPVDDLKQKLNDGSFSYNYSFIESIYSVIGEAHMGQAACLIPHIHCMNELKTTVLKSNNMPQFVDLKFNSIFYYSILMLITANLPFEAIY